MGLYIVPHDIKKGNAWHHAKSGRIKRIGYGLYVDSADDPVEMVRTHAVRIAKALFPGAHLSHASAYFRGATPDGVLYLGGDYRHKTELEGLTIVQNIVPQDEHAVMQGVEVSDPRGVVEFSTVTDEFILLQMFESARVLTSKFLAPVDSRALAERVYLKHGRDLGAMLSHIEHLAESSGYRDAWNRLSDYIRTLAVGETATKRNVAEYTVAWNHRPVGKLINDGAEWMWTPGEWVMPLSCAHDQVLGLPFFIKNLMEEGWLQDVVQHGLYGSTFGSMRRYLANISVVSSDSFLSSLPADCIVRPLAASVTNGVFNGAVSGIPSEGSADFEARLGALWRDARMPVLAGMQKKIPVHLGEDNVLIPPVDEGFTHFIKVPAAGWWSALGALEWMSMSLARAAGVDTAEVALMGGGAAPALLVERFDIRQSGGDQRLLYIEDMCAAMGQDPEAKSNGSIEEVARFLAGVSTNPAADMEALFRMTVVSVVIGNDDFHKKNIALLKMAKPNLEGWESVRLAPAFDMLGRKAIPKPDSMSHMIEMFALSMNDKRVDVSRDDLVILGAEVLSYGHPGTSHEELVELADTIVGSVLSAVPAAALAIAETLPTIVDEHRESRELCQKLAWQIVVEAERLGWSVAELKKGRVAVAG